MQVLSEDERSICMNASGEQHECRKSGQLDSNYYCFQVLHSQLFNLTTVLFSSKTGTSVFSPHVSQSLDTLVSYGSKLKSLNLDLCEGHPDSMSAKDLEKVGALSNLETLNISLAKGPNVHVTHDVMSAIYIGCTKLKFVCLEGK